MAKQKDVIRQIKKATHRQFSAEEKIRIVLEGLRGEPTLRTYEMLCWYFTGMADEDELISHIQRLQKLA